MLNHRQIHNINGTKTASATVENVLLSRGTKAEVFLIILKLYQLLSKSCFFCVICFGSGSVVKLSNVQYKCISRRRNVMIRLNTKRSMRVLTV